MIVDIDREKYCENIVLMFFIWNLVYWMSIECYCESDWKWSDATIYVIENVLGPVLEWRHDKPASGLVVRLEPNVLLNVQVYHDITKKWRMAKVGVFGGNVIVCCLCEHNIDWVHDV